MMPSENLCLSSKYGTYNSTGISCDYFAVCVCILASFSMNKLQLQKKIFKFQIWWLNIFCLRKKRSNETVCLHNTRMLACTVRGWRAMLEQRKYGSLHGAGANTTVLVDLGPIFQESPGSVNHLGAGLATDRSLLPCNFVGDNLDIVRLLSAPLPTDFHLLLAMRHIVVKSPWDMALVAFWRKSFLFINHFFPRHPLNLSNGTWTGSRASGMLDFNLWRTNVSGCPPPDQTAPLLPNSFVNGHIAKVLAIKCSPLCFGRPGSFRSKVHLLLLLDILLMDSAQTASHGFDRLVVYSTKTRRRWMVAWGTLFSFSMSRVACVRNDAAPVPRASTKSGWGCWGLMYTWQVLRLHRCRGFSPPWRLESVPVPYRGQTLPRTEVHPPEASRMSVRDLFHILRSSFKLQAGLWRQLRGMPGIGNLLPCLSLLCRRALQDRVTFATLSLPLPPFIAMIHSGYHCATDRMDARNTITISNQTAASTQDHIQIACVPVSMEESNSLERHVAWRTAQLAREVECKTTKNVIMKALRWVTKDWRASEGDPTDNDAPGSPTGTPHSKQWSLLINHQISHRAWSLTVAQGSNTVLKKQRILTDIEWFGWGGTTKLPQQATNASFPDGVNTGRSRIYSKHGPW